ncbi:MAG: hypothetical protein FVQ84_08380 [Planctomycetes bacterium]|nr:hypothetical protein [Planctomycetota bacterium]
MKKLKKTKKLLESPQDKKLSRIIKCPDEVGMECLKVEAWVKSTYDKKNKRVIIRVYRTDRDHPESLMFCVWIPLKNLNQASMFHYDPLLDLAMPYVEDMMKGE